MNRVPYMSHIFVYHCVNQWVSVWERWRGGWLSSKSTLPMILWLWVQVPPGAGLLSKITSHNHHNQLQMGTWPLFGIHLVFVRDGQDHWLYCIPPIRLLKPCLQQNSIRTGSSHAVTFPGFMTFPVPFRGLGLHTIDSMYAQVSEWATSTDKHHLHIALVANAKFYCRPQVTIMASLIPIQS